MGEKTDATSRKPHWTNRLNLKAFSSNPISLIVGGLVVAVLAAGVLIQVFRAEPGAAAEPAETSKPGTAKVARLKQVARVGEQTITYDMLAAECVQRYGQEVLENLINRAIIQQACLDRGITISEAEVVHEVQRIAEKFKLPVETWYKMLQTERNLTPLQYQRDIIWPMLALRKIAGDEIVISEQDIQRAFERDYGPKVKARMIMMENFRQAAEVQAKAHQNPDDFGRLARQYSIEPTSRALDGSIPPIRKYAGSEEIWKRAFQMKPNEVSGVIEAGPGRYVILLCEGFTEPVVTDINEVRDLIVENIREEKRQEAVAKVFERLKEEVRVDNFLTNTTTGGIKQAKATANSRAPYRSTTRGTRGTTTAKSPRRLQRR